MNVAIRTRSGRNDGDPITVIHYRTIRSGPTDIQLSMVQYFASIKYAAYAMGVCPLQHDLCFATQLW